MLSLEIKINREKIAHAIAVRREMVVDEKNYVYSVEARGYGKENYSFRFQIPHNPDEGAEKLAFLIYQEIDKIKRKII